MTPKSGSNVERYLVSTVTVPPSGKMGPSRDIVEGSLRFTRLDPDDLNDSSGLQVVPMGEFPDRLSSAHVQMSSLEVLNDFYLGAESRASVEIVEGSSAMDSGDTRPARWTWRNVKNGKRQIVDCSWLIDGQIGEMDWNSGLATTIVQGWSTLSAGAVSEILLYKSCPVVPIIGVDGKLRIFALGHKKGDKENVRIICASYDQRDAFASASQHFVKDSISASLSSYGLNYDSGASITMSDIYTSPTESSDRSPQLAACMVNGVVILAVSEFGSPLTTTNGKPGRVHILSYTEKAPASERFRFIKKDALSFEKSYPRYRCEGGVSIAYAEGRFILAVGVVEQSQTDSTVAHRSVVVGAADDVSRWSTTSDADTAFAALGTTTDIFVGQTTHNDYLTDIHTVGEVTAGCASNGAIVLTLDAGKTWVTPTTPATIFAAHAPRPFLRSILVLSSPAYAKNVIYAGGHRGFLMRSLNGGTTWKIVAMPSAWSFKLDTSDAKKVTVTPDNRSPFDCSLDLFELNSDGKFAVTGTDTDLSILKSGAGISDDIIAMAGALISYSDTSTSTAGDAQTGVRPFVWIASNAKIIAIDQGPRFEQAIVRGSESTDLINIWQPPFTKDGGNEWYSKITDIECLEAADGAVVAQEKLASLSLLIVGDFKLTEMINKQSKLSFYTESRWLKQPKALRLTNATTAYSKPPDTSWKANEFWATCAMARADSPTPSVPQFGEVSYFTRIDVITPGALGGEQMAYLAGSNGCVGIWRANTTNINSANPTGSIIRTGTHSGYAQLTDISQVPPTRDTIEIVAKLGSSVLDVSHAVDGTGAPSTLWVLSRDFPEAASTQRAGPVSVPATFRTLLHRSQGATAVLGKEWKAITIEKGTYSLIVDSGDDMVTLSGQSTSRGVYIRRLLLTHRTLPTLFVSSSHEVLLSTANISGGWIEVWKATAFSGKIPTFERVNADENFTDTKLKGSERASKNAVMWFPSSVETSVQPLFDRPATFFLPRQTFMETDEGYILLSNLSDVVAARVGEADTWYGEQSLPYPFPLKSAISASGYNYVNDLGQAPRTLSGIAYGDMRLFYMTPFWDGSKSVINLFLSRDWDAIADNHVFQAWETFPPILNKKQCIGIGDIGVQWVGTPPVGDKFYMILESPYPLSNLVKESPSFYWRSGSVQDSDIAQYGSSYITLVWDRQSSVITDVLGEGTHWNVNAFAMFGSNFPYAQWRISVPGYNANVPPQTSNDYTQFDMNAVLDTGVTTPSAVQFGTEYAARLVDAGKQWPVNYWASGLQDYYVMVSTNPSGLRGPRQTSNIQIRRIISNTADTLLLEGDPIFTSGTVGPDTLDAPCEYIIYTDRMFNDGSRGQRGPVYLGLGTSYERPMATLAGTEFEYGRYLELRLGPLVQRPPQGYLRIGTVLFGRHVPVEIATPDGRQRRHKFSKGWRWGVNTPIISEKFANNLSLVRRIGKPQQSFTLEYDYVENWEMDVFYGLLFPDTQQAFAAQFTAGDLRSTHLVRIDGDVQLTHQGGGLFSHGVTLNEVK